MLCLQRYIYFPRETKVSLVNITSFTLFKTLFIIVIAIQLHIFLPCYHSKSLAYSILFAFFSHCNDA